MEEPIKYIGCKKKCILNSKSCTCYTLCCSKYNKVDYLSATWCAFLNKSTTVFTGLNVVNGTSTKTVFQKAIPPFHNPGSSNAFNSFPCNVLVVIKALLELT